MPRGKIFTCKSRRKHNIINLDESNDAQNYKGDGTEILLNQQSCCRYDISFKKSSSVTMLSVAHLQS